ncbi:hypothetical protein DRN73_07345, partial [Candidatus Pacearchaeota archaeon]
MRVLRLGNLLIFSSFIFVVLYILAFQPFANAIKKSTRISSFLYSKLISETLLYAIYKDKSYGTLKEFIQQLDYPIIITDEYGNPRAWCNIGVNPDIFTPEELAEPQKLRNNETYKKILKKIKKLAKKNSPLPIINPFEENQIIGYLYYGEPKIIKYLNLLPFILTLIGLFIIAIMWRISAEVKKYEVQSIWAYTAKELAHQLATPISALNGWIEIINFENKEKMKTELNKINSILKRFSKIGFTPNLEILNLKQTIDKAINEFCFPFLKDMKIINSVDENIYFKGDEELFCWAIENLVKNAWQSRNIENPVLKIESCLFKKNKFKLFVKDNGKGIPREIQNMIFKKPISTRKKGWGMGLLIVKRIIEE